MRELVFGPMPEGAAPATHLPAGPWCFSGREHLFPGWDAGVPGKDGETGAFVIPADPFADGDAMSEYARAANGEVIRLIDVLCRRLNQERGANRSKVFWETALTPWLTLCVHMLAERQKRVMDLVASHGDEPLHVRLLPPDLPFAFQSSQDFMLHGVLDADFNHFVFSRIVEAVLPPAWEISYEPGRPLHQRAAETKRALRERVRDWIRDRLRDLPFPRYKGFSLPEALLLSLTVLRSGEKSADRTLPLEQYASAPLQWIFSAEDLIAKCLPKDILEAPLPPAPQALGRLRGMTAAFSQDDRYRLRLAAWREGGGKLFSVQHGANYGNLQSAGIIFFEYRQHAFFTWGWKEHQGLPCNSHPLPHPLTSRLRDAHREQEDSLILVGTEMLPYLYRLKTRPQAGELATYRRDKLRFFSTLPQPVLEKSLYRPYPASRSSLEDGPYVQRAVPGLALCTGDLTQRMLACRLLVLDHYGTTLHMAMAANVPTLCFWSRREWAMEPATDQALDALAAAGILHTGPEGAAMAAARIWPDVRAWWANPAVQAARMLWLDNYARCLPSRATGWSPELLRVWRAALRAL